MTVSHNLNYIRNYSEKSSVVNSTFGLKKKILNLINFVLLVKKIQERNLLKGKKLKHNVLATSHYTPPKSS